MNVRSVPPRVCALLSHRGGETQQIQGLAEGLARDGWDMEVVRPGWRDGASALGLARAVTLTGFDRATRERLQRMNPDLVVSAALRNEPALRWLGARGARTVMLGRTWAPSDAFDLVVTTPQYRLPAATNVVENATTLHRVDGERLAAARAAYAERYAGLPRPRLGVLVGGNSGPFTLGARAAARLVDRARELAGQGSLLVTTSPRTAPAAERVLSAALRDDRSDLSVWRPGEQNPYFGILAWADALLVTGDSIAMLSEAVATGRPVRIFDLGGMRPGREWPRGSRDRSAKGWAYSAMMRLGPARLSRDLTRVHQALVEADAARWDDAPLPPPIVCDGAGPPLPEPLRSTVRRVAALI